MGISSPYYAFVFNRMSFARIHAFTRHFPQSKHLNLHYNGKPNPPYTSNKRPIHFPNYAYGYGISVQFFIVLSILLYAQVSALQFCLKLKFKGYNSIFCLYSASTSETAKGKDNVHESSVGNFGRSFLEDTLPWYIYAWRGGNEDQPAGVQSTGKALITSLGG